MRTSSQTDAGMCSNHNRTHGPSFQKWKWWCSTLCRRRVWILVGNLTHRSASRGIVSPTINLQNVVRSFICIVSRRCLGFPHRVLDLRLNTLNESTYHKILLPADWAVTSCSSVEGTDNCNCRGACLWFTWSVPKQYSNLIPVPRDFHHEKIPSDT
jgi:hypothetical protein